jgi:hypothetical protein
LVVFSQKTGDADYEGRIIDKLDNSFPNFHYVKLVLEGNTLRGAMYRLDLETATPTWQEKDTFDLRAR